MPSSSPTIPTFRRNGYGACRARPIAARPPRAPRGAPQGMGQGLMERTVCDADSGQLVTASLMDYALPRAADVPAFRFETRNVRCRTNPLGVKGAGEAGAIGSCPAVMNAIVDALWRAFRIRPIDMPATPQRISAAIEGAPRGPPPYPGVFLLAPAP